MRRICAVFISAVLFISCPDEDGKNTYSRIPADYITRDSNYWFKDIYENLIERNKNGTAGQIADYQDVCEAINFYWGAGAVEPETGTESNQADCGYLLKMIDKANSGRTEFSAGEYADSQAVDDIAVNDTVRALWVPGENFIAVGDKITAYSETGKEWIIKNSEIENANIWYGAVYGKIMDNGIYTAVGLNGAVSYSNDGINWTSSTSGSYSWRAVTYGGGKFAAVGLNGITGYSTDGVHWITTTSGINSWYGTAYGGGIFTAVGANGVIGSSADGVNWKIKTTGSSSWRAVAYGNGLFIAVGDNGATGYSADGVNWTIKTSASIDRRGAAYGNGIFAAACFGGAVSYSADGINWTSKSSDTKDQNAVVYGSGMFISCGADGITSYSSDGMNWTVKTSDAGVFYGAAFKND